MNSKLGTRKIRILFIGTADFAIPSLRVLLADQHVEIVGVITQPDKPVGREQNFQDSPVKQFMGNINYENHINIFQPVKLKLEAEEILTKTTPDLIVVAAYGQIIPKVMLDYPKYGAINIHGSLLPELRGAVPVQMAILNGLEHTGVTIQRMVQALDAGAVLGQISTKISPHDTTPVLMGRLSEMGAELLISLIPKLESGEFISQEQDDSRATFCYQADVTKEKAEIKYNTPTAQAERMVRAFLPWPVAWVATPQGKVQIFESRIAVDYPWQKPVNERTQFARYGKRLFLLLEDGVLEVVELQLEGKVKRAALDYLFLAETRLESVQ